MDKNQGYEIIQAVMLENGRGFALGHNPAAPSPYVTWACYDDKNGQRQYDFLYDAIAPAESDLQWRTDAYQGTGGTAALRYVSGAAYPQPLSHYFRLEKDGEEQYVALSTASACPVELN